MSVKDTHDTTKLRELKESAFKLMKRAGYPVSNVAVVIDENLPYMGHTTEMDGLPLVVISGIAFTDGMALSLLIHELSHVYRTQTGHPSHDAQLIFSITAWVMHGKAVLDYQEDSINTIVNHIQDLYADDIFFTVFDKDSTNENINEFFMGWVHNPIKKVKTKKHSWTNAEYMLSAAFAQANLYRHNIKDVDGKLEKAVEELCMKLDKNMRSKYEFFKNFMINLPEHVTEKEFENLLIRYLGEFLKIANAV